MKLRVIVGDESTLPRVQAMDALPPLHREPGLRIEGEGVIGFDTEGRRLFIGGDVVGLRGRSGGLTPVASGLAELTGLAGRYGVADWRRTLEGRWIAAVRRADGAWEIGADAFGRYDVYYQRIGGQTIVATSLDLLPVSVTPGEYDQAALAHVVTAYGWRPPKHHTLYRGVRRLGVGETLHVRGGEIRIEAETFRPMPAAAYTERDLDEYADALLEAVRASGSRSGNVIYLSSGWDSTALLACLVKLYGARKVRAVTGRMLYSDRSGVINQFEIDRAGAMAEYFGVRLDIVDIDFRKQLPPVFERMQPIFRQHQLAGLTLLGHGTLGDFVARTTNGDETVFAGEISDGVHNLGFSQYATIFHPSLEFREYADKMGSYLYGPTFLNMFRKGQFSSDLIYDLFRRRASGAVFDEPAATDIERRRQFLSSFFLRGNRLPLWSLENTRLLTAAGRRLYTEEIERPYLGRAAEEVSAETLYSWYMHLYNSFHWQGSTVTTIAATGEALGLRMALPFWDTRLHDFLSTMPETFGRGLDLNPTKYPLKWTLRHRVDYPMHLQTGPHSYLYDVDPTFSHAAETLYRSAFATYFKERLRPRAYRKLFGQEFFDVGRMDALVDRYLAGEELQGGDMGDLVTLCWLSAAGWYGAE
jgi:hypothetical protein